MALFRLSETRLIDTEQVADIRYTPAETLSGVVVLPRPDGTNSAIGGSNPSYLNITLKTGEEIRFSGDEAGAVWDEFSRSRSS